MSALFVDIHLLQTVPPSNLNRDDTGSPKTAVYGGVQRARVSSQAWKRASRKRFNESLKPNQVGYRTKHVVDLLTQRITDRSAELAPNAEALATEALKVLGIKLDKPRVAKNAAEGTAPAPEQPGYLLFLSSTQLDRLADLVVDAVVKGEKPQKNALRAAADEGHSVDVALFGRMVADAADLNVDAAAQVAHALSVHEVANEFDYLTAVDDESPEENTGAGMIGTVEFNSATLYRYATINVAGLEKNLGNADATVEAVRVFLDAFVRSMPTGKQNTFANRTLPDGVVVSLRQDQPVNLVGAFEEPVSGPQRLEKASRQLVDYAKSLDAAYGSGDGQTFVVQVGRPTASLGELGTVVSLDVLVDSVGQEVRSALAVS